MENKIKLTHKGGVKIEANHMNKKAHATIDGRRMGALNPIECAATAAGACLLHKFLTIAKKHDLVLHGPKATVAYEVVKEPKFRFAKIHVVVEVSTEGEVSDKIKIIEKETREKCAFMHNVIHPDVKVYFHVEHGCCKA